MMDRSEQGIALIAVIWALALLSIIAANMSVDASTSTRIARNIDESAVAQAAADAGIQRAILDLETSTTTAGAAGFRSDGTVYAWRFSNSAVLISIKDEASKTARAGAMLAAGAVLALIAGVFLLVCVTQLLALIMPDWAAALVVALAVGIPAAILISKGRDRLKVPMPGKTIENVKENVEWMKNQTRS